MNRRQLICGVICFALCTSFSWGAELDVCKDGCTYDTIGAALSTANEDDTIIIMDDEVYQENNLTISVQNLTIKSDDPNTPPTVEGTFYVTDDGLTLDGLIIGLSPFSPQFGVIFEELTSGHTIKNCDIGTQSENNFPGIHGGMAIFSNNASNYLLENNKIHNWIIGVLSRGSGNTISGNELHDTYVGVLSLGNSCMLYENEINDTIYAAVYAGNNNTFNYNSIHDNHCGLWLRGKNVSVEENMIYSNSDNKNHDPNSMSGGIIWRNCEALNIYHNTIRNNENGIVGYYGIGAYSPDNQQNDQNRANHNNIYDNADFDVYYDPNDPDDDSQAQEWFDARQNYWGDDEALTISAYVDASEPRESPYAMGNIFEIPAILPRICGSMSLPADLSGPDGVPDCKVDIYDLMIFAQGWLLSTEPSEDAKTISDPWWPGPY